MKTDVILKSDVRDELEWGPSVNSTGIGVAVKDGVVTSRARSPATRRS
jgi:osmotically-inducible protein OsmY